jgi:hypothetical protein
MRFISRHVQRGLSGALLAALAALAGCPRPDGGVAGQWRLSWEGRIGTERATLLLLPDGSQLHGSFRTERAGMMLSGTVQSTRISFTVDFPGPPPYRILFSGVVHGDRIDGEAQAQDTGGRGFAGHGGEVAADYYHWSATRVTP